MPELLIEECSLMEKTFLMVKPDGVQRNVIGEIVARFEKKGYNLAGAKLMQIPTELAEEHYGEHKERPFFGELVEFMTRGPIVAAILEKENAVEDFRTLIGATNPEDAAEGTIRKKYAKNVGENAVHGSDSDENAQIEGAFHFAGREMF